MIWFTLFLFAASFLLTVLLAPDPKHENARAGNLGDIKFPQVSEGSPVPLVFGKVRLRAPNCIWYGHFTTKPVGERVKTGWFSSKIKIKGYKYYVSFHLALCTGPSVTLKKIWIDKRNVYSSAVGVGNGALIHLNKPNLFGGDKRGGGFVGYFSYYSGEFTNAADTYLQTRLGNDIPGYVGIANILFRHVYIGTSPTLRSISFEVERYPDNLGLGSGRIIGDDLSLMEILYSALTEKWGGIGLATSLIDDTSLTSAASTLSTEQNAMSIAIQSGNTGKSVIQEILRQADGILYQDPVTGKIVVKLIRDDYVVGNLPVFDESNVVSVSSLRHSTWAETHNQVRVTFNYRTKKYQEAAALAQDMANINAQGGRVRSLTLSFPGVTVPGLAVFLATRELSQVSVPLFSATFETTREAYQLKPGDPFVLSWDEYNISEMVMRVQRFDLGELVQGRIVMEALQDQFTAANLLFAAPDATLWDPLDRDVVQIQYYELFESPYFFLNRIEDFVVQDDKSYLWCLPKQEEPNLRFDLAVSDDAWDQDTTIELSYQHFPDQCVLVGDIYENMGCRYNKLTKVVVTLPFPDEDIFLDTTAVNDIRVDGHNLFIMNGEIFAYETFTDNGDGTYDLEDVYRALLDTTRLDHVDGDMIYFLNDINFLSENPRIEQDLLYYRLLAYSRLDAHDFDDIGGTYEVTSLVVTAGGSGYAADEVLTVVGGTSTTAATIRVDTVDGSGEVLTATVVEPGQYSVQASSPVSVTGGSGSSATFTLTWTTVASGQFTTVQRADLPMPPDALVIETQRGLIEHTETNSIDITDFDERNRTSPDQVVLMTDSGDTPETSTTYNARFYLDDVEIDEQTGLTYASLPISFTGLVGSGVARIELEAERPGSLVSFTVDSLIFNYNNYQNLGSELLTNGDFEVGISTGWTTVSGTWDDEFTAWPLDAVRTPGGPTTDEHVVTTGTTNELRQDHTIGADSGKQAILRAYKGGKVAGVTGQLVVELRDASSALDTISTPLEAVSEVGQWELIEIPLPLRSDATIVRTRLIAPAADSVWDNISLKVNSVTPTATPFLYDNITGLTVEGAWGLRQMDSGYSGALVRIRDTYDNSESDIGFDTDGNLDPFFVKGEARVVKLYDQSGNSADLEQTVEADQPRLKWLLTQTGRPWIDFENDEQLLDQTAGTSRPYMVARPNMLIAGTHTTSQSGDSYLCVIQEDESFSDPYLRWGLSPNGSNWQYAYNGTRTNVAGNQNPYTGDNVWFMDYQQGYLYHNDDATNVGSWTAVNITYPSDTRLRLGRNDSTGTEYPWDGEFTELCIFSGTIAAGDRQTIMEDVADYWFNLSV